MKSVVANPLPSIPGKLITCILKDDGRDKRLMQGLRRDKQILNSSSIACRGISMLEKAVAKHGQLPEPTLVRMVQVVVSENQADEIFDYIFSTANIGCSGGGTILMGPLLNTTLFELPIDIPDEKE